MVYFLPEADLGGGCRGCAPPEIKASFFVFTLKRCLPHQSVMPFLGGAPSPEKILGPPPSCSVDHLSIVVMLNAAVTCDQALFLFRWQTFLAGRVSEHQHMSDGTIGPDRRLMQQRPIGSMVVSNPDGEFEHVCQYNPHIMCLKIITASDKFLQCQKKYPHPDSVENHQKFKGVMCVCVFFYLVKLYLTKLTATS